MHIPLYFSKDFELFKKTTRGHTARTICVLVKNFNAKNIKLHIPTIRYMLDNDVLLRKQLKDLLKEYD